MGRGVRILLAAVVALLLLAGATYAAVGAYVYDEISRVDAGTCVRRFPDVTPATFAYDSDTLQRLRPLALGGLLMPDYRAVSFAARAEPDVTIRGWFIPALSGGGAPAVIMVPGRASCRRDWNVLVPAGMLHRAGFAVLLIDLRNHGASDVTNGRYAGGMREFRDVLGAWDWLRDAQGMPATRIGLFGASLGSAAALIAAGAERQVAAVWEDSSYADTETRINEELTQRGYPTVLSSLGGVMAQVIGGDDIYATSPLTAVRQLGGRPLFIAHGAADTTTSVHHAEDLAAAARGAAVDVAVWIVPGAEHTQEMVVAPAEYEQRLVDFFRVHLGA